MHFRVKNTLKNNHTLKYCLFVPFVSYLYIICKENLVLGNNHSFLGRGGLGLYPLILLRVKFQNSSCRLFIPLSSLLLIMFFDFEVEGVSASILLAINSNKSS